MSSLDYALVVPSRKRVHTMPVLRSLLPTALICVDERERQDYAPVVPSDKLLLHPPVEGAGPGVHNWMIANIKAPILIRIDDDFVGVLCTTGSQRKITAPGDILAILENAARACQDLGLSVFCFSRTANVTIIHPEERPIVPTQMAAGAWGVMNAARNRAMDLSVGCRCDLDFSLRTLLEDRCVYADIRFYFDFGLAGAGAGGGVGLTTSAGMENSTRILRKRWGRYLAEALTKPGQRAGSRRPVKIQVKRTNQRAVQ